jgi:hypothetical protein
VLDNTGAPIKRGDAPASPLDFGAGHIRPTAAFDPGLVLDATPANWLSYVCATEPASATRIAATGCNGVPVPAARDLNQPVLSAGAITQAVTFRRTLSNSTNQAGIYFPAVTAPLGYTVSVTPSALTVLPRRSASVTVTITRSDAVPGRWEFGDVTFSDVRGHVVRLPLAARAVRVDAPVVPGFTGTLTAHALGPVPAQRSTRTLDPRGPAFNPSTPAASTRTAAVDLTVAQGGLARIATRAADHPAGTDIDVYVYRRSGTTWTPAGSSNGTGSDEEVVVDGPGDYRVFHYLYAAPTTTTTVGRAWVLAAPSDDFVVDPATSPATAGAAVPLTLSWHGLEPGQEYAGAVLLLDDEATTIGRTMVAIAT